MVLFEKYTKKERSHVPVVGIQMNGRQPKECFAF